MNRKNILLLSATLAIAISLAGTAFVYADSDNNSNNFMSQLAEKIAGKFNLSTDDVQAVIDDYNSEIRANQQAKMEEMQASQEQKIEDELNQALENGDLTQTQVNLILEKREELLSARLEAREANMDQGTSKTKEEIEQQREQMQDKMQAAREDLQQCLQDNNISVEYMKFLNGAGRNNAKMGGVDHNIPCFGGTTESSGQAE